MSQTKVEKSLNLIEQRRSALVELAGIMIEANKGRLYEIDFLYVASIHRSVKLIDAFLMLARQENFVAAIPLVRMHLDSILRVFAGSLTDDPPKFVNQFIDNTPVRNMKDADGNLMTDRYLVEKMSSMPGLEPLQGIYNVTSGFVHFSVMHLKSVLYPNESRWSFHVGGKDSYLKEADVLKFTSAMDHLSTLFGFMIRDWIKQKDQFISDRELEQALSKL
jgi:hypothetical protein